MEYAQACILDSNCHLSLFLLLPLPFLIATLGGRARPSIAIAIGVTAAIDSRRLLRCQVIACCGWTGSIVIGGYLNDGGRGSRVNGYVNHVAGGEGRFPLAQCVSSAFLVQWRRLIDVGVGHLTILQVTFVHGVRMRLTRSYGNSVYITCSRVYRCVYVCMRARVCLRSRGCL